MKELSIILVNYNTTDDIINCINSIISSDIKIDYEIIVIDNDSENQKTEIWRIQNTFPQIKIIAAERNMGFAGANNVGIKFAQGKNLLFLNPDTLVQRNTIMNLYRFLTKNKNAGMIGPFTIDQNAQIDYYSARVFPNLFTEFAQHSGLSKIFIRTRPCGCYFMSRGQNLTTCEVDAIQGSAMLVRKSDIEEVGPMDERFFLFCEDTDWCYRFRRRGKKIYLCTDAIIIHIRHASARGRENLTYIIGVTSMYKFFTKYYGQMYGIIYRIEMLWIYQFKSIICLFFKKKKFKIFISHVLWAIGMLIYVRDRRGHPKLKTAGFNLF
ncbi:MAG: glycosyltransferase family 2 protein [bacterium]